MKIDSKVLTIAIAVTVVVVAVVGWFWFASTHRKHYFDRDVRVEGEADYNDFYVLAEGLRAQHVKVQAMPHLPPGIDHWNVHDSLLLGSDLKTLSPEQVDSLLDWVGRGGRLIVTTAYDRGEDHTGILNRLGVAVPKRGYRCMHWEKSSLDFGNCFATFVIQSSERDSFQTAVGDENEGWLVATRSWGLGQIEVVGDFGILNNRRLEGAQNIDWAWQIVAPMLQPEGTFHIVYQTELPPLYVYIVKYGWYALLPLLVALLAWLWMSAQRFGPPRSLPEPDRRALGEHIQASGEYLYRQKLISVLYAPLRRRFDDQLRRRDPELAAMDQAVIAKTLAERQKLPFDAVLHALRPPLSGQHKAFLTTVQTLLHLIRNL